MAIAEANAIDIAGFEVDNEFEVVPMRTPTYGAAMAAADDTFVVRGIVASEEDRQALEARPDVVAVWTDTPIAPFQELGVRTVPFVEIQEEAGAMATCPIPPCDCSPGSPRGTIADVARHLGVDQIWAAGFRGAGIVVGVVDGGITAAGRPVKQGETGRRIPRVVGGWPGDWGTEAAKWSEHGNMTSTDVLGMAPEAQIYDLRISDGNAISQALGAFQWAIDQHRANGTPQVLSNSWGIFREEWDGKYARDPNHPFTRKVVEAIDRGILVLFAAGNCGATCPDGRCLRSGQSPDTGPGRSIWGANGHPRVMTVGAVNLQDQYIGYSSQGPAALDPNKPDFCGIAHFTGYFNSDSGTSAACPIVAGVVALLKQGNRFATQVAIKTILKNTARDLGPGGFDHHTGSGRIQAKLAFDRVRGKWKEQKDKREKEQKDKREKEKREKEKEKDQLKEKDRDDVGIAPVPERATLLDQVAQLASVVEQLSHFISRQLRPDVTQSALDEPDADLYGVSERLESDEAAAKQAKDAKDMEKASEY
jgi:subtilisin family serine protease